MQGQNDERRDEDLSIYPIPLDEGLRLHRAFAGISNPALREAIINLVVELARREDPE